MPRMRKRFGLIVLLAVPLLCLCAAAGYSLPPVHDRLAWRVETLLTDVRYALHPPEQVVFVPQSTIDPTAVEAIVRATLGALATPTPLPGPTATRVGPTPTPLPSPTSTLPPTPIPAKVNLTGIRHEYQQLNNCGPTTLAMTLSFWGWQGDQRDTRAFLRPNFAKYDDKNVMPAEMVRYVETQAGLKALVRVGGEVDLLKRLVAAGFPVIVEKGLQQHPKDWMGHYALVSGYDDARQRFITQDSYIMPDLPVPYKDLSDHWWRDFNYVYLVIYPPQDEAQVMQILGPQVDETYNDQYAAQKAKSEIQILSGRDLYFAWFNLGTDRLALGDYAGAAQAYDQAFALYPTIPDDDRPWRMLWYQVGPYAAYYYTGRYDDVINLGNATLSALGKPILEETFYWMGKAREAQGDLDKAIQDYQRAVELNPESTPARAELQRLGVTGS
jgi:hypothetical protein